MKGGVRGKYVSRYRAGTNLVLLQPDVAKAFPTDAAVNDALRAVMTVTDLMRRSKRGLRAKSTIGRDRKQVPPQR